jgi:hypothetical protein
MTYGRRSGENRAIPDIYTRICIARVHLSLLNYLCLTMTMIS